MSINLTGSKPEPIYWPSQIKARLESAKRYRDIQRTGGLQKFAPCNWQMHFKPLNQAGNSCLGFSRAQCIWLWLSLRGRDPQRFPSPYRAYWYARRRHLEQNRDGGTYPSSIWWAGESYGDVELDVSRFSVSELMDPPLARDDLRAVDVQVIARPIYDSGQRLLDRICDSLALLQPVQVSLSVSRDLLDSNGPELVDVPDEVLNLGHAMTIMGCRESTTGSTMPEFLLGNSWGEDWRHGGACWFTGEYISRAYRCWYVEKVEGWA